MDPAFEGAGAEQGLEIWRIENFQVVAYPKEKYGQFYQGDSYIVLYTTDEQSTGKKTYDLHFWLGSETSQDEKGTAAYKSVELDDALGGVPVQHREVEGYESALFSSRFKKGVRYLQGGVASGFHHVDPDAPYPARLFKVKGRRNVRIRQVACDVSKMNQGDCFVLDAGKRVYVYMGPSCRRMERVKAVHAGNAIRDEDHAGSAKVLIIDETATPDEVGEFFEALGGGSPDEITAESEDDDVQFEKTAEQLVSLHKIWEDDDGVVQTEIIGEKPLLQSMLDSGEDGSQDCFLLDTGSSVYAWIGRNSSKKEKVSSLKMAHEYLAKTTYPFAPVERVCEGTEPAVFKSFFKTWKEPEDSVGLGRKFTVRQMSTVSAISADFNVSSLHAEKRRLLRKNAGPAIGFMPDDGSGKIELWRIENFELEPVDESIHGYFFGGDSYVLKYTYELEGREKYIIYFWQGAASSQDEKASSAIHAVNMDNDLCGKAVQVRVVQGYEPAHFLRMFKGRMVIFLGGKASGFKNIHDHDTYDVDGTRLFQVRGTCDIDTRAVQRPEVADSLNSDDVFVLETPENTYLWIGEGASEEEKAMGHSVAAKISPERDVQEMTEGSEDDGFWGGVGGQGEYQKARDLMKPLLEPRLFHCSVSPAGCLRVNEVANFIQEDLNEDDVMVLDSGDEVYIWIGQGADQVEKEKGFTMAEDYIKSDPTERSLDTTVLVRMKQNEEPAAFTSIFPSWNPEMWQVVEVTQAQQLQHLHAANLEILPIGIEDKPTLHKFEPFDPSGDASVLRKAMKGLGTDEDTIIGLLTKRTSEQRHKILKTYNTLYNNRDCIKDLKSELHGKFERAIVALMMPLPQYLAQQLHHAMHGPGTKDRTLVEILCSLNNQWIYAIKNAYYKEYEKQLVDDIKDDTSGDFRKLLISFCDGKRDEINADPALASTIAQQLHKAGEAKFGTDESEFIRIMTSYSYPLLKMVFEEYKKIEGKDFSKAIDSELSGDFKKGVKAIYDVIVNRPAFFAKELHDCMSGLGTRDSTLIRLVVVHSEIDMQNIKEEYLKLYNKTLVDTIKGDTSGDYKKVLLALVE